MDVLIVLVDPKLYRKHVRYSFTREALLYVCITKALSIWHAKISPVVVQGAEEES